MLLIFGVSDKREDLGSGQTRTCPRCGNTTAWARIRTSRRFTLFFIPIIRWGSRSSRRARSAGRRC